MSETNYNTFVHEEPIQADIPVNTDNVIITDNIYINQDIPLNTRKRFIIRVYTLLITQLLITSIIMYLSKAIDIFHNFYYTDTANMLCSLLLLIMFIYHCIFRCFYETANKTPYKELYLILVTCIISYILSYIYVFSSTESVLIAGILTMYTVLFLTLYAYQTKIEYNTYGNCVALLLLTLFALLFFPIFTNMVFTEYIFSILGAILFSMFIVYDIHLIIGGNHQIQFRENDVILASTTLYFDIINYFLCMLNITRE